MLSKSKVAVLAFNLFYLPGYRAGGPIRTIANMVDRLGDEIDFHIITLDRDSGDHSPYTKVDLTEWNTIGGAKVRYLSRGSVSLRALLALVREVSPDFIYLNSFFDPTFTQRILALRRMGRLNGVPIVLAPRGEFSPGALDLKRTKKGIHIRIAKLAGLYRGITWQASSTYERDDILRAFGGVPGETIKVAMDLAPKPVANQESALRHKKEDALRICFLSRISPKKNLDFALECLTKVKASVAFTIYGPQEVPDYWAKCEAMIALLPSNVAVTYGGEVEHALVRETLAQHDLFLLPTRGENYGHVIHEALSAALPILISDQTPWQNLEEKGLGWALPLDSPKLFVDAIHKAASLSQEELSAMRRRAVAYAFEKSDDAETTRANRDLFRFSGSVAIQ